jgi:hypothetical protein
MELTIVNADPKYAAVKLIEPTALGYIHIATSIMVLGWERRAQGKEVITK